MSDRSARITIDGRTYWQYGYQSLIPNDGKTYGLQGIGDDSRIAKLVEVEGGGGSGSTYIHTQGEASATWTIEHNLGKYPSVAVVDSAGTKVETEVYYNSPNILTVSMKSAFKGKAYLN